MRQRYAEYSKASTAAKAAKEACDNASLKFDEAQGAGEQTEPQKKAAEALTAANEARAKADEAAQSARQAYACSVVHRDAVELDFNRLRSWAGAVSVRGTIAGAAPGSHILGAAGAYTWRSDWLEGSLSGGYARVSDWAPAHPQADAFSGEARLGLKWGHALYSAGAGPVIPIDRAADAAVRLHLGVGYRWGDQFDRPPLGFAAASVFAEPWIALDGRTTHVMFGLEWELGLTTEDRLPKK